MLHESVANAALHNVYPLKLMSVRMLAWRAVTNLKQVGKVVHIYEVCVLSEAIQGGHQQRKPFLSTGCCQLIPCIDRHNDGSSNVNNNNSDDDVKNTHTNKNNSID